MPRSGAKHSGKTDREWEQRMREFAAGRAFTTGQTPGSAKWKGVMKNIKACPRHHITKGVDITGVRIVCKCGYHKVKLSSCY